MNIAVIGGGAFGSYIIDALIAKYPEIRITLFEVGGSEIRNEEEIGYKSNILAAPYSGLSKGRYFGFGGATTCWGGQILTFTNNDFKNPSPFLRDIIKLNEKYQTLVYEKFGIKNNTKETHINGDLFLKTGIWLSYFHRNLFKYFRISDRKNVKILSNSRVVKIISNEEKRINKIIYKQDGIEKEAAFDYYFLTAGAFESNRILLNSELVPEVSIPFSDHLSQKVFKIKGGTKIGDVDFAFSVDKASLITKRLVGEFNSISFFANPVFNSDFPFFQNLKKLLFKREIKFRVLFSILKELPSLIAFIWCILIKRKVYVYKNEWFMYIDIENPLDKCNIRLANNKDNYSERALDVNFYISENASSVFTKAKSIVKEYLIQNHVQFEEVDSSISVEKSEDTYHPFGMMSNFDSVEEYFMQFRNMLIVNTGILPRAGGINCTAAIFPLIEEFLNKYME
jgi:hypothetical protein